MRQLLHSWKGGVCEKSLQEEWTEMHQGVTEDGDAHLKLVLLML